MTYDCNNDGQVNEFDLDTVTENYNTTVTGGRDDGDFDGDGDCDFTNLTNLLGSTEWQSLRRIGIALPN